MFFSRIFYYLMAIWSVNPYFEIHPTLIVLIVYSHYHLEILVGIIPIIMIYIYIYITSLYPHENGYCPYLYIYIQTDPHYDGLSIAIFCGWHSKHIRPGASEAVERMVLGTFRLSLGACHLLCLLLLSLHPMGRALGDSSSHLQSGCGSGKSKSRRKTPQKRSGWWWLEPGNFEWLSIQLGIL